jgi:DNA-binding IclR family transcriptional regulator
MTQLNRTLAVLQAFEHGDSALTADQLSSATGYPAATTYRYIRELCDAGLLVRHHNGYAPGPRIIEWDRMMRAHDPLVVQGREIIDQLVSETGLELLVSQLYGDRIVNVHYEHTTRNAPLELGRGSIVPLFRGSTSRVILAEMPARQLRRLYADNLQNVYALAIGSDWKRFSKALADVRRLGYAMSSGELHPTMTGIAAPVFGEKHAILGSITLIGNAARFSAFREDFLSERIVTAAQAISDRLAPPTTIDANESLTTSHQTKGPL